MYFIVLFTYQLDTSHFKHTFHASFKSLEIWRFNHLFYFNCAIYLALLTFQDRTTQSFNSQWCVLSEVAFNSSYRIMWGKKTLNKTNFHDWLFQNIKPAAGELKTLLPTVYIYLKVLPKGLMQQFCKIFFLVDSFLVFL